MQKSQLLDNKRAREYLGGAIGRDAMTRIAEEYPAMVVRIGNRTLWPISFLDKILEGGIAIPNVRRKPGRRM